MLFAVDIGDPVAIAVIISAPLTALFTWLTSREKIKYDGTIIKLTADVDALKKNVGDCHEDRETLRAQVERHERERKEELDELRNMRSEMQDLRERRLHTETDK